MLRIFICCGIYSAWSCTQKDISCAGQLKNRQLDKTNTFCEHFSQSISFSAISRDKQFKNLMLWEISAVFWLPIKTFVVHAFRGLAWKGSFLFTFFWKHQLFSNFKKTVQKLDALRNFLVFWLSIKTIVVHAFRSPAWKGSFLSTYFSKHQLFSNFKRQAVQKPDALRNFSSFLFSHQNLCCSCIWGSSLKRIIFVDIFLKASAFQQFQETNS
jgi:hypothetical protein